MKSPTKKSLYGFTPHNVILTQNEKIDAQCNNRRKM